jgi:hypothetical protein
MDRTLKNKPAQIRKESKADIVMKRMFGTPQPKTDADRLPGGEAGGVIG